MKRKILLGLLVTALLPLAGTTSWALPGVLQNAARAGFWSNSFPDTTLLVDNYIYKTITEQFDSDGDKQDLAGDDTYHFTGNLLRLIRPWHFGDEKQYQFILQGIIPYYNFSTNSGGDSSGMGDPLTYTALGWNNAAKTTAIQTALVIRYPLGDQNAPLHTNAYAVTPTVAIEQKFGSMFMCELAAAYQKEFHKVNDSDTYGQSYFELNGIATVMFGAGWDAFLQADYTAYDTSKTDSHSDVNAGYNFTLSPGIGNWFRPNMQLSVKYDMDLKGEDQLKGDGVNIRYVWIF